METIRVVPRVVRGKVLFDVVVGRLATAGTLRRLNNRTTATRPDGESQRFTSDGAAIAWLRGGKVTTLELEYYEAMYEDGQRLIFATYDEAAKTEADTIEKILETMDTRTGETTYTVAGRYRMDGRLRNMKPRERKDAANYPEYRKYSGRPFPTEETVEAG